MNIIQMPRQGGKTERSILWLTRDPRRVLIAFSVEERKRLARTYPVVADQIVTTDQVMRGHLNGSPANEVGIDNLDIVLSELLGVRVGFATVTEAA